MVHTYNNEYEYLDRFHSFKQRANILKSLISLNNDKLLVTNILTKQEPAQRRIRLLSGPEIPSSARSEAGFLTLSSWLPWAYMQVSP